MIGVEDEGTPLYTRAFELVLRAEPKLLGLVKELPLTAVSVVGI